MTGNSPSRCPAPPVTASLAVRRGRREKDLRGVEKKADYAISTLGNVYICIVYVFYFDFILLEKETREKKL